MLSLTLVAIIVVVVPLTGPFASATTSPTPAQAAAYTATARVQTIESPYSVATGVFIGQRDGIGYLLTAEHAYSDSQDREVQLFDTASFPAPKQTYRGLALAFKSPAADLALVKVALGKDLVPIVPIAKLTDRPRAFPAQALSFGCGKGQAPTARSESLRAKRFVRRPENEVAFFWETSAPPIAGRSGGPILDTQGRLLGVCAAAIEERGYYTHLEELHAALSRNGYAWILNSTP